MSPATGGADGWPAWRQSTASRPSARMGRPRTARAPDAGFSSIADPPGLAVGWCRCTRGSVHSRARAAPARGEQMHNPEIHVEDHESVGDPVFEARQTVLDARRASSSTSRRPMRISRGPTPTRRGSDADQTSSGTDQTISERDQRASDKDQAASDLDRAGRMNLTPAEERAYDSSREQRASGSFERLVDRLKRAGTAHDRDLTSADRDRTATAREQATNDREGRALHLTESMNGAESDLLHQLEELAARAAVDRARAAADRERARLERADAARERARLESELALGPPRSAHRGLSARDGSHGAVPRDRPGAQVDGRFVLAFVDVTGSSWSTIAIATPRVIASCRPWCGSSAPGCAHSTRSCATAGTSPSAGSPGPTFPRPSAGSRW